MIATTAKYSGAFYDETSMTSLRSAQVIVPLLLSITEANSVIDVGCGTGGWLATFQQHGLTRVTGIDCESLSQAKLQIDKSCLIKQDLTEPFAIDSTYDLAMCLEVAEHLPERCAPQIVDNLCKLSDLVLFSAAIPHQGGTNHINEQWPEYWANLFAKRGFVPVDCIRSKIWHNEEVAYWYAQNLLLYVRKDCIYRYPNLKRSQETTDPTRLTLVHPKVYVKNYKTSSNPIIPILRLIWNVLPRALRLQLVKPLSEFIWKQVSTKY